MDSSASKSNGKGEESKRQESVLLSSAPSLPTAPTSLLPAAHESLRAQFFLTRPNGMLVPLVPMDELPPTINFRGVPRSMSTLNIHGMTSIGNVEPRYKTFSIEKPDALTPFMGFTQPSPLNTTLRQEDMPSAVPRAPHTPPTPATITASTPRTINDLRRNVPTGTKRYCSYWMRNGECDYAQQGCLYLHEMPQDLETFETLGLRDIPKWYREMKGLPSFHSQTGTLGGNSSLGKRDIDSWRSAARPPPPYRTSRPTRQPGYRSSGGGERPYSSPFRGPTRPPPIPRRREGRPEPKRRAPSPAPSADDRFGGDLISFPALTPSSKTRFNAPSSPFPKAAPPSPNNNTVNIDRLGQQSAVNRARDRLQRTQKDDIEMEEGEIPEWEQGL